MKIKIFIVLALSLLLMPAIHLAAQDRSPADSLAALLENTEGQERFDVLKSLAETESIPYDERVKYAEECIEVAGEVMGLEDLVESHILLGTIHYLEDENKDALASFEDAYQLSEEAGYEDGMAIALNWKGSVYLYTSEPERAVDFFKEARDIASRSKNIQIETKSLYLLAEFHRKNGNYETALELFKEARPMAEETNNLELLPDIIGNTGLILYWRGDYQLAAEYYQEAAELYLQSGAKFDAARMYLRLGNAKIERAEYDLALQYLQQALPIFEETNSAPGIDAVTNSMGVIYFWQELYDKALEVYLKGLELSRELNAQAEIARSLENIGNVYNHLAADSLKSLFGESFQDSIKVEHSDKFLELFDEALRYYKEALDVREELNEVSGQVLTLINLGIIYVHSGKPAMALDPLQRALEINKDLNNKSADASILLWLAQVYFAFENYTMAQEYLENALIFALETDTKENTKYIYNYLSQVYEKQNDYVKALRYHKLYYSISDTLTQEDRRKAITDMQVKYETEATEKENALLTAESELADAKLKQTRAILIITIFAIGIFIVMMVQLIRQNNLKRKANKELALKNDLITEQKKEITDSIQYASRIQNAMLPPGDYVDKLMPERFIIYMPRDIVSGDYYYITEKDGRIICVAADCTGHGVPGAFMSMLGIAYLNEIISKHAELHTDEILGELRNHVIKSLHQTGKEGESQDGMDLALFILDPDKNKLEYSGANNSLLIYREGELIEYKSDKMPIGIHNRYKDPFTRHQVDLKKGDMIYTFSDGYPDQFGGPRQKKFMIKNFKRMLMDIHMKSMTEQQKIMEDTLQKWMADTEQIDDILVIGVRV